MAGSGGNPEDVIREALALVDSEPAFMRWQDDEAKEVREKALAALAVLVAARDTAERRVALCRPVVERYGAVWAKDEAYYAAAEALGIEDEDEDGTDIPGIIPGYHQEGIG